MAAQDLAGPKKKAHNEGRTLVFIDESGLSQKPHRCRSWAPRGKTPVLSFNFNWERLSVSAGLTLRNFYFRLYPGAIGQVEVIDFLKALLRHIDKPLLIVWDRLPAHRSRLVREFIELSEGHIVMEYLPPYAPELNPVEYIWSYWKHHVLQPCPRWPVLFVALAVLLDHVLISLASALPPIVNLPRKCASFAAEARHYSDLPAGKVEETLY